MSDFYIIIIALTPTYSNVEIQKNLGGRTLGSFGFEVSGGEGTPHLTRSRRGASNAVKGRIGGRGRGNERRTFVPKI